MSLTSENSESSVLCYCSNWKEGFTKMDVEKPENYQLLNNYGGLEGGDSNYAYNVSDEYDGSSQAWAICFETDEHPKTVVTHFPEKEGVKMSTDDSPSYSEGKERAVLGVALLSIVRSGEDIMVEL